MKKCPACGHRVESKRDKLGANVFTWTAITVTVWALVLYASPGEVSWWRERRDVVIMFAGLPVVATYYWVQFLRSKK